MDPPHITKVPPLHPRHDPNLMEAMTEHERTVASIDGEIEALMRIVRQLQYKKIQHQEKIKEYKGRMTLARHLPPEILASIFEHCVRDGWTRTPLTVSHVCPEWRKATNIPSVWSHVYINCDAKDPQGRTRFWLDKSQDCLLHVTIDIRNDTSQLPGNMNMLLEHLLRWHTLVINAVLLSQVKYILMLCNRPASELRTLDISILQECDDTIPMEDENHLELSSSFPRAPHFHKLRINRNILPSRGTLPPSITNLSISLPWHSVRIKLSTDRMLRVLDDLPQLQSLSLELPRGQEREFDAQSDEIHLVNLPNLTTLVVVGSQDFFSFLPHLFTPALTRLHLYSSLDPLGYPDERVTSYIERFIRKGSHRIELFELHDIDLSLPAFSTCLAGLPHLRELRLHESEISDSIIEALNGAGGCCPLLKRLDLRWCGRVTGQALVNLVESRLSHATDCVRFGDLLPLTPLDHVTVINCAFVREQDVIRLAHNTICRVVMGTSDYCRSLGCCQNKRYRHRLQYHCAQEIARINSIKPGSLIL